MRIVKDYDERRNEILDISEELFHSKGYERCTVNDIIKEVKIAKGTFYYYFKSKEEVLDAVVSRYTDIVINRVNEILKMDYKPEVKLMNAFLAMQIKKEVESDILDELHKSDNALLHQKTLNQMVSFMAPVLVNIIEEGIEKKIWICKYPLEYMQIFLAASLTLTDEGIFKLDKESQMNTMAALITILEKMLEVPGNSFLQMFAENFNKI